MFPARTIGMCFFPQAETHLKAVGILVIDLEIILLHLFRKTEITGRNKIPPTA